jgi:hypothetical protein
MILYCNRPDGSIVPVVAERLAWARSRLNVKPCKDQAEAEAKYRGTIESQKLWTRSDEVQAKHAVPEKERHYFKKGRRQMSKNVNVSTREPEKVTNE